MRQAYANVLPCGICQLVKPFVIHIRLLLLSYDKYEESACLRRYVP